MALTRAVNDFTVTHYNTNTTNLKLHTVLSLSYRAQKHQLFMCNYENIPQPQLCIEICNTKF